ncbi:MAG: RNA-binding S4 domain-containing protein [Clostridia bacterium]|nr:RNA-binding S4 domain-containing protein [Clostridia bacterium]
MKNTVLIKSDYIKLDSALKCAGLVSTGGHAKIVIQNGEVKVNGEVCTQRGRKLKNDDTAEYNGKTIVIKYAG